MSFLVYLRKYLASVRRIRIWPFWWRWIPAIGYLALTYADMGRMEDAHEAAQQILELNPRFSARGFVNTLDNIDPAWHARALATLRQLGLPE